MKIGYSYWGFLTGAIEDTPDGARFVRPILVREMLQRKWTVICLQKNREPEEFLFNDKLTYSSEFPDIDLLFLEWRWPIPGRNTEQDKEEMRKGYTPDLERQMELLSEYTIKRKTITLIWDGDRQLTEEEKKGLDEYNVVYLEPAFVLRKDFKTLMFPIDFERIDEIYPKGNFNRQYLMGFIWNNYKKDFQINRYLNPVANFLKGKIHFWGNWTKYPRKFPAIKRKFPNIIFHDRISFNDATKLYQTLGSTMYLCPKIFSDIGSISPRFLEAIFYKCPLFIPAEVKGAELLLPKRNIINDFYDLAHQVMSLRKMSSKQRIRFINNQTNKFLENKCFSVVYIVNQIENFMSETKRLVEKRKLKRRIYRGREDL